MQNYGKKCTKTIFKKDKNVWQSVKAYGKTSRKLRVSGVTTVKKKKVTLQKKNPHTGEKTENQLKNIKKKLIIFQNAPFWVHFLGAVLASTSIPPGVCTSTRICRSQNETVLRGGEAILET